MCKKTERLQKSVPEEEPEASLVLDDARPITKVAKKGKKRKLDNAKAELPVVDEAQDGEASKKRYKKSAVKKAAKKLSADLSEVQALLQEVKTSAQLGKAMTALKNVQGLE